MTPMTRLLAAEFRKARATPTLWWLLAGTVLLTGGVVGGGYVVANLDHLAPQSGAGLQDGLHAVGVGTILGEIAGVIGMAGEYRFGQADQTFLSTPRRSRLVTAKAIVYTAIGTVFGLASAVMALLVSWSYLSIRGVGLPMHQSLLWETLLGAVLSAALSTLLGVAVGALLRNQVVAIVTVLGVETIVETAVFQASTTIGKWLPGESASAIRRFPADGLLSPSAGVIVLAVWAAALLAFGYYQVLGRDVT